MVFAGNVKLLLETGFSYEDSKKYDTQKLTRFRDFVQNGMLTRYNIKKTKTLHTMIICQ